MRVLFLTHRLPYAPNRGDRLRAYYMLRHMARFASVSLLSLVHDDAEAAATTRVPWADTVVGVRVPRWRNFARGAMALPSSRPLTHVLLDAPGVHTELDRILQRSPPDVVLAYCSSMARFAVEPPLAGLPFVLDMLDVDSAKWSELARRTTWPMRAVYRREARTLGRFEQVAARAAHLTLVVNQREADTLAAMDPALRVAVVPNGIELEAFRPPGPAASSPVVVFCGVLDYPPNEAGVTWFVREVWPLVRAARTDARFIVVGAGVTRTIEALAAADPSVTVTGAVDSVQEHLWQAAVSVAPLHLARGVQNKVLEALASGLPVVTTRAVAEGLPAPATAGCLVADEAGPFANRVIELLTRGPEQRRAMAAGSGLEHLGWDERLAPLEGALRAAAATRTPR